MTAIMPATTVDKPPAIVLEISACDRGELMRVSDVLHQVLAVTRAVAPKPTVADTAADTATADVTAYIAAAGIRDVTITPAPPRQPTGERWATVEELAARVAAMGWYPPQVGDVVTVDHGAFGGQTYQVISHVARGASAITCPRCRRVSHHPGDIAAGYCGACHDWTAEPSLHLLSSCGQPGADAATSFTELLQAEPDALISLIRGGHLIFARPRLPLPAEPGDQR